MTSITDGEMEQQARALMDMHMGAWDEPHRVVSIIREGDGFRYGTMGLITLDVHPVAVAGAIIDMAVSEAAKGGAPPVAWGYLGEGFIVSRDPLSEDPEYAARMDRARLEGTYEQQPESVEVASALVADATGRMYELVRRRAGGEDQGEMFPAGRAGGKFAVALKKACQAYGIAGGN